MEENARAEESLPEIAEAGPEPETEESEEELRIGVYVCHCGLNIAQVVDCAAVAEYAATLPDVVVARENMYSCADPGQIQIKEDIAAYGLNRVVVAACSVKMHGPTFMNVCQEAGLNPYLMMMANIREHCSWVHRDDPEGATRKAMEQVKMAVAKVRHAHALHDRYVPVKRAALVIGGGMAGMQAALDMADAGYPVFLVEREPFLGGRAAQLLRTFDHMERMSCLVSPLAMKVLNHPLIRVFTLTEVESISGYVGNFQVRLARRPRYVGESCDACGACAEACPVAVPDPFQVGMAERKAIYLPHPQAAPYLYCVDEEACTRCGACAEACPRSAVDLGMEGGEETVEVGAVVLAVGAQPYRPPEENPWSYDGKSDVFTSLEMERMLHPLGPTGGKPLRRSDGRLPESLAFIQCVGSRDPEGNAWCSRICCMNTIKQALILKALYPSVRIYVYHRDIRAYKKDHEDLYRLARDQGVIFLRAPVREVVPGEGGLVIHAYDEVMRRPVRQEVDMVVLATGMVRRDSVQRLQDMLKVPSSADGFLMEAHPKLRPLETAITGVMLAGSCQFPKDLGDCLLQGSAAAAKCLGILGKEEMRLDAIIAHVNPERCNGCLVCFKRCPFSAIVVDEVEVDGKKRKRARVIEASCKGCGICAARCKQKAIEARGFSDPEIFSQIDAALEEDPGGKVLALVCHW
ncbi:CoB--CoM heterodisulfide reductase iron-sulfur subunit A family protein [Candidatus Solincola tengchongensis]|uniref:CoB--CoM heterodisulfide reductase iron-sulfur subunit A family protein n=1 Tax=Candidatus Solincola tengchongensis TaxID=2900693 RepID=UPI002580FA3A|nr:CoB--CoM heterodisulfide reductase iron-sulfur subunit A family protein [Candidatus Solincola tengchongensis]